MVALSLCLFPLQVLQAEWARAHASIMGTEIAVEVWHREQNKSETAVESVLAEMRRVDALMSVYKNDSEMSQINQYAAEKAVSVSDELFYLIRQALDFSVKTKGAFDITYASVGYLYNFRESTRPDQQAIESALPGIDYRLVALDDEQRSVRFLKNGVRIDLGGIAKGYAVDQAISGLKKQGIEHARVTAGGDTRVLGTRLGRPWTVGIRDPRLGEKMVAVIPLLDEAISTSGDYERYFDESGIRYHHIINPETGDSARGLRSVSIIGPQAVVTDALSTSVFVLGIEAGIELINSMQDYEAIIVDNDGELHYSKGLEQFQATAGQENRRINHESALSAVWNSLRVNRLMQSTIRV